MIFFKLLVWDSTVPINLKSVVPNRHLIEMSKLLFLFGKKEELAYNNRKIAVFQGTKIAINRALIAINSF